MSSAAAAESSAEESHRGVHFDQEEETGFHDNKIKVVPSGAGKAIVHCGLLKIHHRYHLTFEAPKNLLPESEDVTVDLPDPPNPNCRLLKLEDSQESDSHASLTVELVANKEKLQKETVSLVDGADRSRRASFVLQARVLGQGKGTPMLKDGVQMVEALPNPDESDIASDWKGF